jgi:hypothetical protein
MSELLVALISVAVGAILTAVIAYPLGRTQGRQQTLYEEQVKIISEIHRLVRKTEEAMFSAAHRPGMEDDWKELWKSISALGSFHRDKSIWLYPPQNAKITAIIRGYEEQANKLRIDPSMLDDVGGPVWEVEEHRASEGAQVWFYSEGRRLAGELEQEAKRLLGTDQRPLWQRMWG